MIRFSRPPEMSADGRLCACAAFLLLFTLAALFESDAGEIAVCRYCGEDVADSHHLSTHLSPNSKADANVTLFGRPNSNLQVLVNPLGVGFKVVTASKALCTGAGHWVSAHSWFPGFLWKFCICSRCSKHLGWIFEPTASALPDSISPSEDGFVALILDNVVPESYLQSLLITPKPFRS